MIIGTVFVVHAHSGVRLCVRICSAPGRACAVVYKHKTLHPSKSEGYIYTGTHDHHLRFMLLALQELAKALNTDINSLPLSLDLSWFEQKVSAFHLHCQYVQVHTHFIDVCRHTRSFAHIVCVA